MNNKDIKIKQLEVLKRYHVPSMQNYCRRKVNSIHLSPANSLKHEMAKCEVCYRLLKDKQAFITEAATKDNKRRVDIVNLNTGTEIEIECDKSRAKRFKGMSGVMVLKLWEDQDNSELLD